MMLSYLVHTLTNFLHYYSFLTKRISISFRSGVVVVDVVFCCCFGDYLLKLNTKKQYNQTRIVSYCGSISHIKKKSGGWHLMLQNCISIIYFYFENNSYFLKYLLLFAGKFSVLIAMMFNDFYYIFKPRIGTFFSYEKINWEILKIDWFLCDVVDCNVDSGWRI